MARTALLPENSRWNPATRRRSCDGAEAQEPQRCVLRSLTTLDRGTQGPHPGKAACSHVSTSSRPSTELLFRHLVRAQHWSLARSSGQQLQLRAFSARQAALCCTRPSSPSAPSWDASCSETTSQSQWRAAQRAPERTCLHRSPNSRPSTAACRCTVSLLACLQTAAAQHGVDWGHTCT